MKEVAVGIDIGGTFTKYGIVDKDGNCLISGSISTTKEKELDKYLLMLKKTIDNARLEINEEIEIKGIGIGAPNGNFYKGTIEYAPNLSWKGIIPFVEERHGEYGKPTKSRI